MGILLMLKEGGSLGIDTIGNKPIDEDIDLLPDAGGAVSYLLQKTLWQPNLTLDYISDDYSLLLIEVQYNKKIIGDKIWQTHIKYQDK